MVFPQLPRYHVDVAQGDAAQRDVAPETGGRGEAVSSHKPAPLVPVSAEDFARARRRMALKWLGAGLLLLLVGVWIYLRSTTSQDTRKALNDGEKMLKAGRYAEAIQSLDRVVAADRRLADAYRLRARANAGLNQTQEAIRDFTKVTELQPDDAGTYVERATLRLQLNDYAGAIADCGEAVRRDPKLAYAYTLRGMALSESGNPAKALEDLNRAVELAPGLEAYFQRAIAYQALGEHRKAIADLDQVIYLFPTSPMGYLVRAKSREALGDASGARSDRETSLQVERQDPRR